MKLVILIVIIEVNFCFYLNEEEKGYMLKNEQNFRSLTSMKTLSQIKEDSELKKKLNNFLAYSAAMRADELALINYPEKEDELKHLIVNDTLQSSKQSKVIGIYGSKSCSLTELAIANKALDATNSDIKICPWHYQFQFRPDRFPHMRLNAKCNCDNCLAKTVFDTEERYSYCKPVYVLMPVLIRKEINSSSTSKSTSSSSILDNNYSWEFGVEPVANSCVCAINLKPF